MDRYELYSQRIKNQTGELDCFKYTPISREMRIQAFYIVAEFIKWASGENRWQGYLMDFWKIIAYLFGRELGNLDLIHCKNDYVSDATAKSQMEAFFYSCRDLNAIDFIEILFRYLSSFENRILLDKADWKKNIDNLIDELNHRFRQHALGYEFINGHIVRKDNQYIHSEAVKPALQLLHNALFANAEKEFFDACEHRLADRFAECIHLANSAFESVLKIICEQMNFPKPNITKKSAGPYLQILRQNQFYPIYTEEHFAALCNTLEKGLPNVRNHNGSHGVGSDVSDASATLADYALHLAATDIVFLVNLFEQKKKQK